MASLARWLTLSRQQWKILLWAMAFLYLVYWFLVRRVQIERERFDNIHYQVSTRSSLLVTASHHEIYNEIVWKRSHLSDLTSIEFCVNSVNSQLCNLF